MKATFTSLDRQTTCTTDYERPDRYRDLLRLPPRKGLITRGAGVSYVGGSFGSGGLTVAMISFDRILACDPAKRTIEVEAGVSLGKLYEFLLDHGLYLSVQPGFPQITIGGCIAFNVHGKNQVRESVFAGIVRKVRLFHPRHGMMVASRDENAEIFELTIGGLGLTGVIVSAELSLSELPGDAIDVEHLPFGSLAEGVRLVDEIKNRYDLVYAWSDLSRSTRAGRGYVIAGSYAKTGTPRGAGAFRRLDPSHGAYRPKLLGGPLSPLVNSIYEHNAKRKKRSRISLFSALYPAAGREFYFESFGSRGFLEQQTLVPTGAISAYLPEFLATVRAHQVPIALTTVKAFAGKQHLLTYNGTGISLTIDVAAHDAGYALLNALDAVNIRFGAMSSITKDSRISARVVEQQYPEHGRFRDRLRTYDPDRLFSSALSDRLAL
jgi:decaprenylphospho-beta-D-ribofuranose 2-oxidase